MTLNEQLAAIVTAANDLLTIANGKVTELEIVKQTAIDVITLDKTNWDTDYAADLVAALTAITGAQTTATDAISAQQTTSINAVISQEASLNARINNIELYFRREKRGS